MCTIRGFICPDVADNVLVTYFRRLKNYEKKNEDIGLEN